MKVVGYIDRIDPTGVNGWAYAPTAPGAHLPIDISLDEAVVGSGVADRFRPDLKAVGVGKGNHSFHVPFNIRIDPAHFNAIEVFAIAPDGTRAAIPRGDTLPRFSPRSKKQGPPVAEVQVGRKSTTSKPEGPGRENIKRPNFDLSSTQPAAPSIASPQLDDAVAIAVPEISDVLAAAPLAAARSISMIERHDRTSLKVFIVGSPRSGTSVLLRSMQEVFALPAHGESHIMPAIGKIKFHLQEYFERFSDSDEDLLIKHLPIEGVLEGVYSIIRKFYYDTYGDEGFADKTPSDEAIHSFGIIPAIFPDAKIIMTRRSGVEVVDSYRRKFAAGFRDACENWVRVMSGILYAREMSFPILEVDQFDFTNDTIGVANRIADYLDRPDKATALARFLSTNREDKLSSHDWSRRLTLDEMSWTFDEKSMFIEICGPMMTAFDYNIEDF